MTELTYEQQLHLTLLDHTVTIVKATAAVPQTIPYMESLIKSTYAALRDTAGPVVEPVPAIVKPTAEQINASVTDDWLISFEDGKRYKMLRAHLTRLGMTPEDYRAKWGLSSDYPMTAATYSARRSGMAKAADLGRK